MVIKPPTNYVLIIILLLQGLLCLYYGIHLINRSRNEKYGDIFLTKMFHPSFGIDNDDKNSKGINLRRFGILIILAGLLLIFIYYMYISKIN